MLRNERFCPVTRAENSYLVRSVAGLPYSKNAFGAFVDGSNPSRAGCSRPHHIRISTRREVPAYGEKGPVGLSFFRFRISIKGLGAGGCEGPYKFPRSILNACVQNGRNCQAYNN